MRAAPLALALLVPALAPALASARAQTPTRAQLVAFVDSAANDAIRQHKSPAVSIAVARGGEMLVAKGYGFADLENRVRATDSTVYRIGSITKQFTAAAIMQLAERGKLSLDDELTKWIPDWPTYGQHITIRHLLNHTSGIHNYTSVPRWRTAMALDLPHDSLLAFVRGDTLDFAPGTAWRYSNTGYYLLGVIVEKASGESYPDYVRTHLFEPLGLTQTSYCETAPLIPHRARGYSPSGKGEFVNSAQISMTQPFAAGSLCSTVRDLVAWTRGLQSGKVVSADSYRQMTTPIPLANGKPQRYGFGLGVGTLGTHRSVSHNGGINGFTSQMGSYPDDSLIVVVLTNIEGRLPIDLEKAIAERALGVKETAAAGAQAKKEQ
jgi:CubicO group peptidase (beta-lactamase class C family)